MCYISVNEVPLFQFLDVYFDVLVKFTFCYLIYLQVSMPFLHDSSNGSLKHHEMVHPASVELDESNILKLLERPPRSIVTERGRSFEERSHSDMSITLSPPIRTNGDCLFRILDHLESFNSPSRKSTLNSPRSHNWHEPHPMMGEGWEALRRSLVYYRGHPVGTIAALDHSSEELNYDQVHVHLLFT